MGKEDIKGHEFKKGESGNPNGRPKGSLNRSTIVKRWLSALEDAKNPITGDEQKMSQEDIITLALIKKARKGDTAAYKALMDSGYGAPKQESIIEQTVTKAKERKINWTKTKK